MAIKVKPKEASAYANRAVTYFAIENLGSGCKDLEKAKLLEVSGRYSDATCKLQEEYNCK